MNASFAMKRCSVSYIASDGGFFLAARISGEGSAIHSKLVLFFLSGDQLANTNSSLYASIGPQ